MDDGGRSKYFKAANVGDCVVRAIAIASKRDYKEVYNLVRKVSGNTPRNGVFTKREAFKNFMRELGFVWKPTMKVGEGCTTHLESGEIPMHSRIICVCSRHWVAVINGVIHDTYDSSRNGSRCVYGYWYYNEISDGKD